MFNTDTYRLIPSFDPSALPAGATVTAAELTIYRQSLSGSVTALTVDRGGTRLVALCEPAPGAARELVGANLGYAYSELPQLEKLLVPKTRAETAAYDRVLSNNATLAQLELGSEIEVRDLGMLR